MCLFSILFLIILQILWTMLMWYGLGAAVLILLGAVVTVWWLVWELVARRYARVAAIGFVLLAFVFLLVGEQISGDFYANIITESLSIAATVLIIDFAREHSAKRRRKRDLIEQMGSPSNDFAREAVRLLRREGWLSDGSLRGKDFQRANLEGAHLKIADLQRAVLLRAHLEGTNLIGARLQRAYLYKAHLREANLIGARLEGARLKGADLRNADLRGTHLKAADLRGADLEGAILLMADLRNADLRAANLEGAILGGVLLGGTNLQGADLREANLRKANVEGAIYSHDTIWPDGFDPNAAGAILVEDDD